MDSFIEIEMARGDICPVTFTIRDEDAPIDFELDDIYFTVKKLPNDRLPLFQKSLTGGTIQATGNPGEYEFFIQPEDTNSLSFDETYACDIEVVALALNIKKTYYGLLKLTPETTHASNERVGS